MKTTNEPSESARPVAGAPFSDGLGPPMPPPCPDPDSRTTAALVAWAERYAEKRVAAERRTIESLNAAGSSVERGVRPQAWGPGQFAVVAAFRYCLGRQTYIVQECADWLLLHWPVIEQPVRDLVRRELEAAFVKDDAIRAAAGPGVGYKPLGWDCDRREWERVRSLWANVPMSGPQRPARKDEDGTELAGR